MRVEAHFGNAAAFNPVRIHITLDSKEEVDTMMRYQTGACHEKRIDELLIYLRNQVCNLMRTPRA